jgi:hypothetical protein
MMVVVMVARVAGCDRYLQSGAEKAYRFSHLSGVRL